MNLILQFVFFLSGATGLIYEIIWGRMLTTVFGSTVVACSIVMGVFMGGLALGACFFGVMGDKTRYPIKMYAFLEASIGITALGVSFILPRLPACYPQLLNSLGISNNFIITVCISSVFLLLPAMLIGGTLPVLSRQLVQTPEKLGNPVGTLYGLNTLGAVTGCLFSGFYAIEQLGLLKTTSIAAGINIGIFLCCFFLFRKAGPVLMEMKSKKNRKYESRDYAQKNKVPSPPKGFLLVYAISGATGLAYEVLWIRLLSSAFIGTSYSFAAMLGVCLAGIGLGSLSFRKKADEVTHPLLWFGLMQTGLALWGGCILLPYSFLPFFQGMVSEYAGTSLASQLFEMLAFSGILVFVPTLFLGAMFPLANRIWGGGRSRVGRNVGSLYTVNTLGCVAGSLTAGLFLLPHFGIQYSLSVLSIVNCAIALYAFCSSSLTASKKYIYSGVTAGSLFLLFFFIPSNCTTSAMSHRLKKPWNLLYYYEGQDSNTMILRNEQTHVRRLMTTFFQYIGDTSAIMLRIQKLQAHLPILLAGSPEKILFVGMGTGITPSTATLYSSEVTCCEISKGVINASHFFAQENKDILHNSQVNLIHEDGRHYLVQTKASYDLIIGDLYNATLAGMGNLYSKEYYTLCRNRLRNNGMMCQWISMKDFPEKDLKAVMATFGEVFPHTDLWCATPDILAMIGTLEPLQADLNAIQHIMESKNLQKELRSIGLHTPVSLLAHFLMNQKAWDKFAGKPCIITDDRPYIEYSIPRSLHYLFFKEEMPQTLLHVNSGRTFLVSAGEKPLSSFEENLDRTIRGKSHLFEGYAFFLEDRFPEAQKEYQTALSLNNQDIEAEQFLRILGLVQNNKKLNK